MTQKQNSWDPLLSSKDAESEIVSAAQKREIRNILKSYVGVYDSFSELIQNAMDAVDRRKEELNEAGYKREISITINLGENSFTITDNGIGFKEKELKSFLAPNISFKDGSKTRGNKGVGATYIAYGFDHLCFGTKGNGHSFVGEIIGGRKWVDDNNGIVTRPVVVESTWLDPAFLSTDRGSTFKINYNGSNTRPRDLSWYAATTPEQWLYLLLVKTPLGSIKYLNEQPDYITFSINVIDKDGIAKTLDQQNAAYIFPHTKINASTNIKDVIAIQGELIKQGKDPSIFPQKYTKSNAVYDSYSSEDLAVFRNLDDPERELLKQYSVEAYGYFAYSTLVWDQLNDTVAKLRKGYRVLKGGLQLANNQMAQGDLIVIPLTSNTGYQNQCHVVVHFRGADPDLGRKGFQPELKEVAEKVAVQIVNRLKGWRHLLKSDSGVRPDIVKEMDLHEWVKQQEKHEVDCPLVIKNANFFAPIHEISITSTPQSEQDVIVLFNQLVAGGVIRGIKLFSTSQVKQYDGLFKFEIKKPLENHIFEKALNPLGVTEMHFDKEHTSAPKVLEYKYSLDGLMAEFENGEKNEKDIHLVIAWHVGDLWKKHYEITSLLDLDNIHLRDFHGVTHILHSGNTKFYLIALKELVEYLNDVDGIQNHHRATYSEV
ncbi:MAG: ATP-binding protein [Pseudomonadota bacterium]